MDSRFDKGAKDRLGLVAPYLFMYLSTMDAALRASKADCFNVVLRYEELVERQLDLVNLLVTRLFPERAQQLDNPVRTLAGSRSGLCFSRRLVRAQRSPPFHM